MLANTKFQEESAQRFLDDAMRRMDTRIGITHMRAVIRSFLADFSILKQPTINRLQNFFVDTSTLENPEARVRDARALATRMLGENPSHHLRGQKYNDTGELPISPSAEKIAQDIAELTQKLVTAATPEQVRWFAASAKKAAEPQR